MDSIYSRTSLRRAYSGLVASARRRGLLAVGAGLIAACHVLPTYAQEWPKLKPVTLVAPFAPGGSTDMLARVVAQTLSEEIGQSVVVDNRAGAGGTIGAAFVAKANPDGYTLLLANASLTSADAVYKKLSYDFQRDLDPMSMLSAVPCVLMINKDLPVKDIHAFIAYVKKNPGKTNFGSSGIAAAPHLATEAFLKAAHLDAGHVPYKGSGPMMVDLISGNVQFAMDTAGSAAAQIRGGKVRGLAVTSKERNPAFPDLPTLQEAGLPLEISLWYAVMAPKGTPPAVAEKLHAAILRVTRAGKLQEAYRAMGAQPVTLAGADFAQRIDLDKKFWTDIIRDAGVKPE